MHAREERANGPQVTGREALVDEAALLPAQQNAQARHRHAKVGLTTNRQAECILRSSITNLEMTWRVPDIS